MRIEKINENKIRCTLTKKDLADRELRISELAYGTDKAKELFRDMMQQASYEFGFEADDIPLMIEAIPTPSDSLVLVITKVEDPDELDTRFSKFSPDSEEDYDIYDEEEDAYADEILNCFEEIQDMKTETSPSSQDDFISLPEALGMTEPPKRNGHKQTPQKNITRTFSFGSLDEIITLSGYLVYSYRGVNTVYKDTLKGRYYLVVSKSGHTPEEFNKICNIISEYGKAERTTYASASYYEEHFEKIVAEKAIQILASI